MEAGGPLEGWIWASRHITFCLNLRIPVLDVSFEEPQGPAVRMKLQVFVFVLSDPPAPLFHVWGLFWFLAL